MVGADRVAMRQLAARRRRRRRPARKRRSPRPRRSRSGPLLSGRPDRLGPFAIHSTTSDSPKPRWRACVQIAGRPSCRPAMPPHAKPKSPTSKRFRSGVHGEWSLTTQSMTPAASPLPEQFAIGGLADRRATLELGRAVRDLLGAESEVVRARLHGQRDPAATRVRDHVQRLGTGQVQDVRPRPEPLGQLDDLRDRDVLGGSRPRREKIRIPPTTRQAARRRSSSRPPRARSASRPAGRSPPWSRRALHGRGTRTRRRPSAAENP